MERSPSNQADSRASQSKQKTEKVVQHEGQAKRNRKHSGAKFQSHFSNLLEDLDVNPQFSSTHPTSLDVRNHNNPDVALSGQGYQQIHPGYSQLDRPWANRGQGQLVHEGRNQALNPNPYDTPMANWRAEPPRDGPYHTIGSVANKPTARPVARPFQNFSSRAGTRGSASTKTKTDGKSGERRG